MLLPASQSDSVLVCKYLSQRLSLSITIYPKARVLFEKCFDSWKNTTAVQPPAQIIFWTNHKNLGRYDSLPQWSFPIRRQRNPGCLKHLKTSTGIQKFVSTKRKTTETRKFFSDFFLFPLLHYKTLFPQIAPCFITKWETGTQKANTPANVFTIRASVLLPTLCLFVSFLFNFSSCHRGALSNNREECKKKKNNKNPQMDKIKVTKKPQKKKRIPAHF